MYLQYSCEVAEAAWSNSFASYISIAFIGSLVQSSLPHAAVALQPKRHWELTEQVTQIIATKYLYDKTLPT